MSLMYLYRHAKMNNEPSVTEDADDGSCIPQFIEIIPLHISRNEFTVKEVKDEFLADIKEEPELSLIHI